MQSWCLVALAFATGFAVANGNVGGASKSTAAFTHVINTGYGPARTSEQSPGKRLTPDTRQASWRVTPRVSLRMREDGSGNEDRLFWSRRLHKAVLAIRTSPDESYPHISDCEEKLLGSRRLARAFKLLSTDPDVVPLEAGLHTSSTRMLEDAEVCDIGLDEFSSSDDECSFRPNLPSLSEEDLAALERGERVQRQTRDGRVGTGMVVVDVDADVATVFAVLTDIDRYPERISTVRAAVTYERGEKLLKTQFQISKFRLQINTELRCARAANMLEFNMDPGRPAPFLEDARGFWYLEEVATESASPRTRIWLVADLACSSLLPTSIVDYAAARALPRATSWLKPVMESMAGELPASEKPARALKERSGFP